MQHLLGNSEYVVIFFNSISRFSYLFILKVVEEQHLCVNLCRFLFSYFFFQSGEFIVVKTDLNEEDPPLWRIDGKLLLQKYEPFKSDKSDGKILYRNISTVNLTNC